MHLTDEELIAHLMGLCGADTLVCAPKASADKSVCATHLDACAECSTRSETLRAVLALVDSMPVPDRDVSYPEQVWNRLRWRLERRRARTRQWLLAIAAVLAIVLAAGEWWRLREPRAASREPATIAQQKPENAKPNPVLVYVVGDHLDAAERVLAEVANADPNKELDTAEQQKRAEDLVVANRIYRQTAVQRGDARIAGVLSDIEPILVELSHSGDKLTPEELSAMQKRIDSRSLLFKLRVLTAPGERKSPNVVAVNHLSSL